MVFGYRLLIEHEIELLVYWAIRFFRYFSFRFFRYTSFSYDQFWMAFPKSTGEFIILFGWTFLFESNWIQSTPQGLQTWINNVSMISRYNSSHLDMSKIHIVLLKKAHKFLEVLFGRAVVPAMRPHSLVETDVESVNRIVRHYFQNSNSFLTFRIPFSTTSLPAAEVAPPARKLECWNMPFLFCRIRKPTRSIAR